MSTAFAVDEFALGTNIPEGTDCTIPGARLNKTSPTGDLLRGERARILSLLVQMPTTEDADEIKGHYGFSF
jgi:hypothetical protein